MGLDIDAVAIRQYIDRLKKVVFDQEHGEREELCDDIIEFVERMEVKYKIK